MTLSMRHQGVCQRESRGVGVFQAGQDQEAVKDYRLLTLRGYSTLATLNN